jgi:general secretion pathway protein K
MSQHAKRQRGIVLVVVLVFALLLVSSISTFLRRATIDSMVVRHRDAAARAEGLARGGLQLAKALVLEDRLIEEARQLPVSTGSSVWARASELELDVGEGATLQLSIQDSGARLNLNALPVDGEFRDDTEIFLSEFLHKVIDEMPGRPEEKNYDVQELVFNLVDWLDEDDVRTQGGLEDEYYQGQDPAYRAANRPLLSVHELRLVQGFDRPLVEALEPYLGVFPLAGSGGINPNTAPTWILATLFHGTGGDRQLAGENEVGDLAKHREDRVFCPEQGVSHEDCATLLEEGLDGVFPEPSYRSDVFYVRAEASVGEVRRRLDAVIDRQDPRELRLLAWRMQ